MTSMHYISSRNRREHIIRNIIHDEGYCVDGFIVDKGHINGPEVHSITETGIIIIHNYYTGKLVTKLIARPAQITRYYKDAGQEAPLWLVEIAAQHVRLGYNHI